MNNRHDLEVVLKAGPPIVVIETTDESRILSVLVEITTSSTVRGYRPLFRWSITDGLQRLDLDLEPQRHNADPADVLGHIRSVDGPGVYALDRGKMLNGEAATFQRISMPRASAYMR